MFSNEGNTRSDHQNRAPAGYLAFVGGYANSSGFFLVGAFTSHVTGNVGRLANAAAFGQIAAAIAALSMVAAFFFGAFTASVMLESRWFGHVSRAYAAALSTEAVLLTSFTVLTYVSRTHPRVLELQAGMLCFAMGIQNGLVTRISNTVVRTTHLTGVITDLGIESARWFRYWRKSLSEVSRVRLVLGPNSPERPAVPKILLLWTIALSFMFGAMAGAIATHHIGREAMLFAAFAVASCAAYAFQNGRSHDDAVQKSRR